MPKLQEQDLRDALNEVDFPADKETLVAHAEGKGATEQVTKELRALPPVPYHSFAEVLSSVTTAEATGHESTPDKAERARYGQNSRVAEHMRDADAKTRKILPEERQ